MLRWTSCLFSTVVLHAQYKELHDIHLLFLSVTVLSILYHSLSGSDKCFIYVAFCDRIAAHFAFFYITILSVTQAPHILLFSFAISATWHSRLSAKHYTTGIRWHALFHIVSVIAAHSFIHAS